MPKNKKENEAAEVIEEVTEATEEYAETAEKAEKQVDETTALENRLGNIEALINVLTEKNEQLEKENAELREAMGAQDPDESLKKLMAENDYMNERIPVKLFKGSGEYKKDVKAIYHGVVYQVKRGVTVMLPRAVAAIIRQSEEQNNKTEDMLDELEEEFLEKTERYNINK